MNYVIVLTKGGIFGDTFIHEDRHVCERHAAELRVAITDNPQSQIRFNPPGFGFGAPCPVTSIKDIVVVNDEEDLPESWFAAHAEQADKFAEAINRAGQK